MARQGRRLPLPGRSRRNHRAAGRSRAVVRAVQQELANRKLYLGTVDGVSGRGTSAAITAYQRRWAWPKPARHAGASRHPAKRCNTRARRGCRRIRHRRRCRCNGRPPTACPRPEDPVAAAIRDAEKRRPVAPMIPPAPVPNKTAPNPWQPRRPRCAAIAALNRSAPPPPPSAPQPLPMMCHKPWRRSQGMRS